MRKRDRQAWEKEEKKESSVLEVVPLPNKDLAQL